MKSEYTRIICKMIPGNGNYCSQNGQAARSAAQFESTLHSAVPWLRRLVAGLSPWKSGFDPVPIPVAARSKAWACGRSLAGIVGSNPVRGMDVCVVFVV